MAARRTAVLLSSLGALLTVALSLACGDGGPSPPSPIGASPTAGGSPTPAVCSGDLAAEPPDSLIYGADPGDFLADRFSLASGDFNGDGFDDALIGAPLADGPANDRLNAGEAYVIFGSTSLPATIDLAEGADVVLYGDAANDNFGLTLDSADFNDDGIDDILIGARFANQEERSAVGKTYVVYGRSGLQGIIDTAQGQQDVVIVGVAGGDFAGIALDGGDVAGDGVDDIIIGASAGEGPDNDRQRAGEVYVIPGSPGLAGLMDLAQDPPFFTVYGANANDHLANYIASGDLDGDGQHELILGTPFAEAGDVDRADAGEVYIISVPEGGGSLDLASGSGFTRVTGANLRDGLGHFTAAGDVNGDGLDDIIIGARDADGSADQRNNAGEVHVLFGKQDLPPAIDLATANLDVTIFGVDAGDSLGFTVATGDLNGDDLDDILAGAPIAASCGNARAQGGDAYALFGSADLGGTVDLMTGEYDLSLFGADPGDELGFSLATGDFNGDGKDDILAGALGARGPENQRTEAGEAYIILSP